MRHTALIPVVPLSGGDAKLVKIYCEPSLESSLDSVEHKDSYRYVVEKLYKINLHLSGIGAIVAVNKLLNPKQKAYAKLNQRKFHPDNYDPIYIEDKSGDLSLALLLFLNAAQDPTIKLIAATGALDQEGASQLLNDVKIKTVAKVQEKLEAILFERRNNRIQELRYFFTPKTVGVGDGQAKLVSELPIVKELAKEGIQVIPVDTLKQAVDILKLLNQINAKINSKKGLFYTLTIAIALMIGFPLTTLVYWTYHDIPISFTSGQGRSNLKAKEPYVICDPNDKVRVDFKAIRHDGGKNIIPINSWLGWSVTIGSESGIEKKIYDYFLSYFGYKGYHLALIVLSEKSPPFLSIPMKNESNDEVHVLPGGNWRHEKDFDEIAEGNALILLARPWLSYDKNRLQSELETIIKSSKISGKLDLIKVRNHLEEHGNSLFFPFSTEANVKLCD